MIKSDREYEITKEWAEKFAQSIAALAEQAANGSLEPQLYRILSEAEQSQLDELRDQMAEYEARRDGRLLTLRVDSLDGLPWLLVRARKAAGLSQQEMAERLGLPLTPLEANEAEAYASVSFDRLAEAMHALGLRLRGEMIVLVRQPAATLAD